MQKLLQKTKKDSPEELSKKYDTWLKGSVGTVGLILVMNLIYLIRVFAKKDLNYWFSLSTTEFFLKKTAYFEGYEGSWSLPVAGIAVLVTFGIFIVLTVLSNKNAKFLWGCLVFGIIDSALLAYMMISNCFGDFNETYWIDVTSHAFLLVFIIIGIVAVKRKSELPVSE